MSEFTRFNYHYDDVRFDHLTITGKVVFKDNFIEELMNISEEIRKNKTDSRIRIGDRTIDVSKRFNKIINKKHFNLVFRDKGNEIGINFKKDIRNSITVQMTLGSETLLTHDGGAVFRDFIALLVNNEKCLQPQESDYIVSRVDISRDLHVPIDHYYEKYIDNGYVSKFRKNDLITSHDNTEETVHIERISSKGTSISFGDKKRIFIRIYDKNTELSKNRFKYTAYFNNFPKSENITRFEVMLRGKALSTMNIENTHDVSLRVLQNVEKYKNHLFKYCFTDKLRIPKYKYKKSNSKENTSEWNLITDALDKHKVIRIKNRGRRYNYISKTLFGRIMSDLCEFYILSDIELTPESFSNEFSKMFNRFKYSDKFYDKMEKWLSKVQEEIGSRENILELEILRRKNNGKSISIKNITDDDYEYLRKYSKSRFILGFENYDIDGNRSRSHKRIIYLESDGGTRFYYDFDRKKGSRTMLLRSAWMSGLLNEKSEKEYKNTFAKRYIEFDNLAKSIQDKMQEVHLDENIDKTTWSKKYKIHED